MSKYSKEELSKKSLVEIKIIAKELRIPINGSKSQMISLILDSFKPIVSSLNTHNSMGKNANTIYGIKMTDKEKLINNSKKVEEKKCKFFYYSLGYFYFSTELV
jgi:hypothetical protein